MSASNLIIVIVLVIALVYFFYNRRSNIAKKNVCPKCEGKGHWYGLRHREECKMCDGTGYLNKSTVK